MDFLSNVSSLDETRPSLFELIAQDQLRDLLQPAVRYILTFYAQRYPRYLLRIANSSEELYALLMGIVEWHFLKEHVATFTENFYGLRRERALPIKFSRAASAAPNIYDKVVNLGKNDRVLAILLTIGIPYLKAKLDDQWEIHAEHATGDVPRRSELSKDANLREKIRYYSLKLFKLAYPYANATYHVSTLCYSMAYLFGQSDYHKLSLAFLRQRMGRAKYVVEAQASGSILPPQSSLSPLVFLRLLLPKAIAALKYALPLGIFFLKFLEWWQASDFAAQLARKTSSTIELPPPVLPAPRKMKHQQNLKTCRICGNEIVNPTAIQTGFIFCYVCIYKKVQESAQCPITGIKLLNGVDGLRRLMI